MVVGVERETVTFIIYPFSWFRVKVLCACEEQALYKSPVSIIIAMIITYIRRDTRARTSRTRRGSSCI